MYQLPITNKISYESGKKTAFREIASQLGDGYAQVAPLGINYKYDTWEVTWGALTLAEKTVVTFVLDAAGSWGIISWQPCMETEIKTFRMTKDGYSLKPLGKSGLYAVSCTLVQCFDYA